MPFTSGSTFTGYSVLRLLGRGDTGEVYLAQHPRLPHWNALKVLPATLTEDCEFRDRFMRETPIATSRYHPHILGAEAGGEPGGRWATDTARRPRVGPATRRPQRAGPHRRDRRLRGA